MKYCVDCRYIYRVLAGDRHPQCLRFRKTTESEDPVHGVIASVHTPFCEHARREDGECEPDAKGWEPRVTASQPIDEVIDKAAHLLGKGTAQ